MSFTYGDIRDALADRRGFLSTAGIDYKAIVAASQVHASNVVCVSEKDKGRGALSADTAIPDTDALITNVKRLPLAVFTADCLPVFLYDPFQKVIGIVHAGWRGSKDKISVKAVQLMCDKFHCSPENLLLGFGPALRSCCYEVGREFKNYFPEGIIEKGNRMYCDLSGINRRQLLDSGIKEKNISDSGNCTSCKNFKYFSFRKEGDSSGRMISVIMLK
ncbi:MAG: peptidoglycan editing factor PgeF [Candidatus Omnitrophica bacterium]|jgi:hypothetical protein|nr:peptidoglycan editing factor PgeF [Candidatus Omnitrophota bacterium]